MVREDDLLVVMVANMNIGIKGHDTLIQSAPKICDAIPNVRFVIVGDGALRPSIEQSIAASALKSYFHFLGRRNDIPEILAACDMAVLSSYAEGLPNAVLEYLAAGLPTIATSVGGIPEIIEEGISGILVPPMQPEILSNTMISLLRNSELRNKLAMAGRNRVIRQFNYDRLILQLESLYTKEP